MAQLESDIAGIKTQVSLRHLSTKLLGPSVLGGFSAALGRGPLGTAALPLLALFGLASVEGKIGRGRLTCISGFGSVAALSRGLGGLRRVAVTAWTGLGPTPIPQERGNEAYSPLRATLCQAPRAPVAASFMVLPGGGERRWAPGSWLWGSLFFLKENAPWWEGQWEGSWAALGTEIRSQLGKKE